MSKPSLKYFLTGLAGFLLPYLIHIRFAFLARGWHLVGPDEAAEMRALAATLTGT